jgi:hypothetical protein
MFKLLAVCLNFVSRLFTVSRAPDTLFRGPQKGMGASGAVSAHNAVSEAELKEAFCYA